MTPNQDQGSTEPIRILHVDDESDLQVMAKRILQILDPALNIESASSPSEALEKIKNNEYDCIVSDYQMPGMDGVELARRIREFSDIPIILFTGKGSEEVASKAFSVGVNDYIRKEMDPSNYEVLVKRIRAAVEERRVVMALVRSENRYRTLLEKLPDPVTMRIGDRRVYATKRAVDFWGYDSVSDLLDLDVSEMIAPEDWAIIVDRRERREKGEEVPGMYEVKIRKADGSTVDTEVHTARIDYHGTPALLIITRDISPSASGWRMRFVAWRGFPLRIQAPFYASPKTGRFCTRMPQPILSWRRGEPRSEGLFPMSGPSG